MIDSFQVGQKAIITRDNKFLLFKGPNSLGQLVWEAPGGRVEEGEDLNEAFKREIFEETGITNFKIKKVLWIGRSPSYKDKDHRLLLIYYLVDIGDAEINISDEHVEFRWVKKDEVASLAKKGEYLVEGVLEAIKGADS